MRFHIAIVIAVLFAFESPAANVERTAPNIGESLGGRLLDDLPPDGQQRIAPQRPEQQLRPAAPPANGFGVGGSPASQPLIRVRQGMQSAEVLLAQPGSDSKAGSVRLAGAVQKGVLSDLDKLIADLSKQCQGQCN